MSTELNGTQGHNFSLVPTPNLKYDKNFSPKTIKALQPPP